MADNWQQSAETLSVDADDVRINLHIHRADPEKGVMLLVHGQGEHSGRYRKQVEHLNARGITAITYDLRGHGKTGGPRARIPVSRHVADLMAVRDAVDEEFRGKTTDDGESLVRLLFGHSMGGLVAAESAIRRPWRLEGLVMSSPGLIVGVDTPTALKKAAPVVAKLLPFAPVEKLDPNHISRDPAVVADYDSDPLVSHTPVAAAAAGSILGDGERMLTRCRNLRVPTLLVHGSGDEITHVSGSRRFALDAGADVSSDPIVTYVEFPGGYHELFNDICADEVYAALDDWLVERGV